MYRARILLCTLAFAVVVPAEAGDLEDAQQLLESGRTSEALERVNRALATNPKDPQPRFLKGLILVRREQEQEAIDIFMKLTQDYPKLPEPYNNLAVIYANRGQYDKARVALEAGARASPTYAVIHENLGDVYAKLASQSYGKAAALDASNVGTKDKLALSRQLIGEQAVNQSSKAEPPAPFVVTTGKVPATVTTGAPVASAAPAASELAVPLDDTAQVLKAVDGWAKAWAAKDVDTYIGYYASDFRPSGGEGRMTWERTRRSRISAPEFIVVEIESPAVVFKNAQHAIVTFQQSYRSDKLRTKGLKTLELVKVRQRWLIYEEQTSN